MTQFIEPNKHSDLIADRVLDWLQAQRTGLLEGFLVTKGSSGMLINIASGRMVVQGTVIYDDLTRIDSTVLSTLLTTPLSNDTHAMIYGTYTATDVFPPSAMVISADYDTAASPSSPVLPADSVKLADIFIESGESDLTNAIIVNAQKMPDRGNADGDVLVEKLIQSNSNLILAGGGVMEYDGVGDEFSWTEDIVIYASTTTHKERFFSPPFSIGSIPTAQSPLTGVGDNSVIFVVFDRTDVNDLGSPTTLTIKVVDLDSPDAAQLNAFFDPATRDNVFWLAMTVGGMLITRGGGSFGTGLPAPDADEHKFLRNQSGAAPIWDYVYTDDVMDILSITSFNTSPTSDNTVEVGVTVTNQPFTATYDEGPPTSATLTKDVDGTPVVQDVTSTPSSFTATGSWTKNDTNEYVKFKLEADAGATPDTSTRNINWYRKVYSGADDDILPTSAIKTLNEGGASAATLRSGRGITITKNGLSDQYFYFAYSTFHHSGDPVLKDNNAFGADVNIVYVGLESSLPTDNGSGNPSDYRLYRTEFKLTGDVNFTVV